MATATGYIYLTLYSHIYESIKDSSSHHEACSSKDLEIEYKYIDRNQ